MIQQVDRSHRLSHGPLAGVVVGLVLGLGLGVAAQRSGSSGALGGSSGLSANSGVGPGGAASGVASSRGTGAPGTADAGSGGVGAAGAPSGELGGGAPGAAALGPGGAGAAGGFAGGSGATVTPAQARATGVPATHGPVRGVTAGSVTVGVATLDLSAVKYLGAEYDNGDVPGQWDAILADWHDRHLLPVNGRDVTFKFASYNVLNSDQQRTACVTLVDDDQSFAVVAPEFFYQTGSDCVAREKRTPLLTSEGPTDDVFARGAPYLFAMQMSESRLLRNFVRWADSRHLLKGHRLGIYYTNDAASAQLMHDTIDAEMKRLGYPPPVEYTTADSQGGYEDALAVQKFRTSGVDVVALLTSPGGFTQQADAQQYRPTYIQTDYNGGTSDVGTNTYAGDQYDGTYGMTTERRGEAAAGIPPTPDERACVDNYNRRSGHHVAPPGSGGHETAEWVFVVLSCDESKVLLHALQRAGPNLTPATFVAGMESVRGATMIRFPDITFGPGEYQGVAEQRTVQWHTSCTCWRAVGQFGPLWEP